MYWIIFKGYNNEREGGIIFVLFGIGIIASSGGEII